MEIKLKIIPGDGPTESHQFENYGQLLSFLLPRVETEAVDWPEEMYPLTEEEKDKLFHPAVIVGGAPISTVNSTFTSPGYGIINRIKKILKHG